MRSASRLVFLVVLLCSSVPLGMAHEVYVLPNATVDESVSTPSPNPFAALSDRTSDFVLYGVLTLVFVALVLAVSLSRAAKRRMGPWWERGEAYVVRIARVFLGGALLFAAYNGSLFGPELPLHAFATVPGSLVQAGLALAGVFFLAGRWSDIGLGILLSVFVSGVVEAGSYMVSYLSVIGLAAVAVRRDRLCGLTGRVLPGLADWFEDRWADLRFFVLRLLLGVSVIYASVYAKFLHSNLALATVHTHDLTAVLPFDPLFLVLGAFLVEIAVGMAILAGFELRFMALLFMSVMTSSLVYFGESVWPHLVLYGASLVILFHGYDGYSLERRLFAEGDEPAL